MRCEEIMRSESRIFSTCWTFLTIRDVPTQFIYIQSEDQMKRLAAEKITDELSRYVVQDDQMSLRFVN